MTQNKLEERRVKILSQFRVEELANQIIQKSVICALENIDNALSHCRYSAGIFIIPCQI